MFLRDVVDNDLAHLQVGKTGKGLSHSFDLVFSFGTSFRAYKFTEIQYFEYNSFNLRFLQDCVQFLKNLHYNKSVA